MDFMKLTIAFCNFANMPKNVEYKGTTGGLPYLRIQYPQLTAARKKIWKIKEINGS